METIELIEVDGANLQDEGCFCLRSKPASAGYQNKYEWLLGRFEEGLKYIKLLENGKAAGFIEYAPIEFSSRVVLGENYTVIHCLWVSISGKGYASDLIENCIQDAKRNQKAGIIVVTNQETSWTPSKEIFLKNGFKEIGHAPFGFELLVLKFDRSPDPYFPNDWDERLKPFQNLTILRTQQCPFIDVATENLVQAAAKLGVRADIIDLQNREELLKLSPTPYGVYGVVFKQRFISFHRLTVHSAMKRLKALV
nr:GNAT family N-acetyltransferase [Neobacillus piezotolerans]